MGCFDQRRRGKQIPSVCGDEGYLLEAVEVDEDLLLPLLPDAARRALHDGHVAVRLRARAFAFPDNKREAVVVDCCGLPLESRFVVFHFLRKKEGMIKYALLLRLFA